MTTYGIIIIAISVFTLAIRFLTIKKEKHNGKVKRKIKTDISWVPKEVASEALFSVIIKAIFGK